MKPLLLMGPADMLRVDRAQEGGCLPGTKHLVTRLTGSQHFLQLDHLGMFQAALFFQNTTSDLKDGFPKEATRH